MYTITKHEHIGNLQIDKNSIFEIYKSLFTGARRLSSSNQFTAIIIFEEKPEPEPQLVCYTTFAIPQAGLRIL